TGHGVEDPGIAIFEFAGKLGSVGGSTHVMLQFAEIHKVAGEEIEPSVVIVPDGAGGPTWSGDTCFFGDIRKSSITIIAVEDATAILGEVKIGEAIGVVIADSNAHAIAAAGHAGCQCDVGKSAVAVVAVKRIAQRFGRSPEIARPTVHKIDVHPTVVVVIEESATRTGGFRQVLLQ